ncbi:MAG: CRISPR system precrRNA processing endoribonuclease RAMP protein Cas6 [bacterium]
MLKGFYLPGNRGSTLVQSLEFHHIIRRLRDRVNALSLTYCGRPINADFKGLADRAAKVKTKASSLRWLEIRRKSRTHGVMHDQSGFVGSITFEGDLREFLPLILAGEYVHVGEDAVLGNGWYRVEQI